MRLIKKYARDVHLNGGLPPPNCIYSAVALDSMKNAIYIEGPSDEVVKKVRVASYSVSDPVSLCFQYSCVLCWFV